MSRKWSWREELNPRPADYKSAALPTELRQLDTTTELSPISATAQRGGAILGKLLFGCNTWTEILS